MLRKGKTKRILQSSISSALLAVEVYNKPRTPFKVESYIALMIMAWTRLFHAHFYHTIGDKYYYKEKNKRYKRIDGERKAWELKACLNKYGQLKKSVRANLDFFIVIRNKIEHRHIEESEIGSMIFGECQSLLYNYENTLIEFFGEEYAINESLAFSLQFSRIRSSQQLIADKKILAKEVQQLRDYIIKYRNNLSVDIFNSQEFSIKLIQIPKISNTNRNDIAIEFVNWNNLAADDKENYEKVTAIIKDKIVKKEVVNAGKLKAGDVLKEVNKRCAFSINYYDHMCLYFIFSIRPTKKDADAVEPFDTDTNYCHYDEPHGDYVYKEEWVDFIVNLTTINKLTRNEWRQLYRTNAKLKVTEYAV